MLRLPGTANEFLDRHWQKEPLFMPAALDRVRPAVTRNEIGWLATLEDVESRLVFTQRDGERVRYSAEAGPFDPDYLVDLPKRDWTLLVHDVEKHLPAMRRLFANIPFIPDWRIDDLMVSFAAPGGSVGPHRDNYDVFLCQGIGVREWRVSTEAIASDPGASDELALTATFAGQSHTAREGDVLYLPPGIAHWGAAARACITYSIGMRAPQLSDLLTEPPSDARGNVFYVDPDLAVSESIPGFISPESVNRALHIASGTDRDRERIAEALGRYVTQTKDWITPDGASKEEAHAIVDSIADGGTLAVHGMARIAWDQHNIYVNGACSPRPDAESSWLISMCADRVFSVTAPLRMTTARCLLWMLELGAFELPEH